MGTLTATTSIVMNAAPAVVWNMLTDPAHIKEYLFGTETVTDWSVGSRVEFRGEWEGTRYVDGGTVLVNDRERKLSYTYWSSMSGTPNLPEHYMTITYLLEPAGTGTLLTIRQENCTSEEARKHSETNWAGVLNTIKELAERAH